MYWGEASQSSLEPGPFASVVSGTQWWAENAPTMTWACTAQHKVRGQGRDENVFLEFRTSFHFFDLLLRLVKRNLCSSETFASLLAYDWLVFGRAMNSLLLTLNDVLSAPPLYDQDSTPGWPAARSERRITIAIIFVNSVPLCIQNCVSYRTPKSWGAPATTLTDVI